jgi:phenylalanine-4-hydroxylase
VKANDEELKQIERLYWFTIEFGLIQEKDLKVYGAGLLSSFGEIQHCLTEKVEKLPFDLETVISTDYDYSKMQDKLFVIISFKKLRDDSEKFLTRIICR